jgi:uncharacterized membrane protein YoaK (UPF0700 family)
VTGFDHPERLPRTLGAVTIVLSAAAGAMDVVTYFAFNQVFASTMTGNLVLLGLGIGQGDFDQIVDNVCAILGYCGGLMLGTVFCGMVMRRLPWRNAVGATLTLELALLLALGVFWYGVEDDDPVLVQWKLVILVVGSGIAMGTQAAAMRYIGPAGTPTTFMSGTVTNWVSALVEPHRPRFNWNSPLRISAVIAAAGVNAFIQMQAPDWSYIVPVVLVAIAIALMAAVTRANHGGLVSGEPEMAPDPREEVPEAVEGTDPDELESSVPGERSGVGHVYGRVLGPDGDARPAVLTLVGPGGDQVDRVHTERDGRFRLQPSESGRFVLICSPHRMGGGAAGPRAVLVTVDGHPVSHDVVLAAADGERTAP